MENKRIGKYRLLKMISQGGMAEVYLAASTGAANFQKLVALKRILPHFGNSREFRAQFELEAQICSQLSHPNIVQIFDFVTTPDGYLLAMEFIDGVSLYEWLSVEKRLSYELAALVMSQVCLGLDYAHQKKDNKTGSPLEIVHRDISPQNILISFEGAVKVVDFGIAKARYQFDKTSTGFLKGKVCYMAPEHANGRKVDFRSDVFACGVVLLELVTGKRLYSADDTIGSFQMAQNGPPDLETLVPKTMPVELRSILSQAMAINPAERFRSAGEMHRSLESYLHAYHPGTSLKTIADSLSEDFDVEARQKSIRTLVSRIARVDESAETRTSMPPSAAGTRLSKVNQAITNAWSVSSIGRRVAIIIGSISLFVLGIIMFRPDESARLLSMLFERLMPVVETEEAKRETSAVASTSESPVLMVRPQGTLALTLSHSAAIYLNEKYLGAVQANQKVELTVPADMENTFRFIREKTDALIVKKIQVKPNETTSHFVDLGP